MAAAGTPRPVAVVIPFYQRRPGLLRRAVDGVFEQTDLAGRPIRLIVVDDASPSPPGEELTGITPPPGCTLEIIGKPNGGAGSARNVGIARALDHDAEYVAFLDSDDWWDPRHLATALTALARGPSFFFANSMHDDVPSFSYFTAMRTRAETAGVIPPGEALPILIAECVPHTSQVVYALDRHRDVRFDETMQRTGEDHLFWLTLAARGATIAYSNLVLGHRGTGVSVYREALAWDSEGFVPRLIDAFHFRGLVAARFALAPPLAMLNASLRQQAADEIAFALARGFAHRPARMPAVLAMVGREGPALWAAVARAIPRLPAIRRRMLAA